jgi:heavy metal sensor kinase
MTIRTRLTLWYAGIMCLSMFAMGALAYYEFIVEPRDRASTSRLTVNEEWEEEGDFSEIVRIVLWCGIPSAALALSGGWWLTRQALAPVAALTQEVGRMHDHRLHKQLPRSGNGDELDRLTEVFNSMTARLDGSFQRIREFTLHASHELKTPLTVLHGELELALAEDPLTPAQRERVISELDELQRLVKIVDSLTLLTKADAGQLRLKREPLQLDDIVRDIFADAQILAKPAAIQVQLAACEPITIFGDTHRLRQLLLNLVDNAIKYNVPRGSVTIALNRRDENAELVVTNTGPGIPPESLPRVFDRFFRSDHAHSDTVEGCGLGLSIAQWIVSAHGGQIQIESEPEVKTSVVVRLPLPKSEAQDV